MQKSNIHFLIVKKDTAKHYILASENIPNHVTPVLPYGVGHNLGIIWDMAPKAPAFYIMMSAKWW